MGSEGGLMLRGDGKVEAGDALLILRVRCRFDEMFFAGGTAMVWVAVKLQQALRQIGIVEAFGGQEVQQGIGTLALRCLGVEIEAVFRHGGFQIVVKGELLQPGKPTP